MARLAHVLAPLNVALLTLGNDQWQQARQAAVRLAPAVRVTDAGLARRAAFGPAITDDVVTSGQAGR